MCEQNYMPKLKSNKNIFVRMEATPQPLASIYLESLECLDGSSTPTPQAPSPGRCLSPDSTPEKVCQMMTPPQRYSRPLPPPQRTNTGFSSLPFLCCVLCVLWDECVLQFFFPTLYFVFQMPSCDLFSCIYSLH